MKKETAFKVLKRGILWWILRILPFLALYFIVKFTFITGYFDIFGTEQSQLVAHNFFVKSLISICAFITLVAIQRYFIRFFRKFLFSFGDAIFYDMKHADYFARIFSNILMYLIYMVVLIIVLNIWISTAFGWMLDLLKSSTVTIISFVFGLLASSVLGNLVAYYTLNKVKEIRPGDRIKINENYGDVMNVGFIFTRIKNLDNEIVSIPNMILVTKGVKNYSRYPEVVVHVDLSLPHGTDIEKAKKVILNGAKKTKKIIKKKDPVLWIKEVNNWVIICEVRVYTKSVMDLVEIRSDLAEKVLSEMRKNKIPTGRDSDIYKKIKGKEPEFLR